MRWYAFFDALGRFLRSLNPIRIEGYEKFWGALLAGSAVGSVATLTEWAFAVATDAYPAPDGPMIREAIRNFSIALAAAFGAYLPRTTGTVSQADMDEVIKGVRRDVAATRAMHTPPQEPGEQ